MADAEKTVFISYRRSTSKHLARSIFMDLRANGYDVFLDVNTLDNGEFERIILNQIAARAHFIVLLSPGSVERCIDENDWLRREIEYAMKLERNIIPVLEEGFTYEGTEQYLTGDLSSLSRFNGFRLMHDYFEEGMLRLKERYLKQPVYNIVVTPTPLEDAQIVQERIKLAIEDKSNSKTKSYEIVQNLKSKSLYLWRLEELDEAIFLDQFNDEAFYLRGRYFYYEAGPFPHRNHENLYAAISDFSRAIDIQMYSHEAYYFRAKILVELGRSDEAILDYTACIRSNSPVYGNDKLADAYYNRALCFISKGDFDTSIADLNQAIKHKYSETSDCYYQRGICHRELGQYQFAVDDFTIGLEVFPENTEMLQQRGMAFIGLQKFCEAIDDFSAAVLIEPSFAKAFTGRALAYYSLGQFDHAMQDVVFAIQANPNELNAHMLRASINYARDKYEDALKSYNEVLRLNPDSRNALYGAMTVSLKLNQYATAVNYASRALSINPTDKEFLSYRGSANVTLGNLDLAYQDLQKYRTLGGNDESALSILEYLKTKI